MQLLTAVRSNALFLDALAASILLAGLIAGCAASNPQQPETSAAVASDPGVREALVTSCYGCHSDDARDPWYARLAPSRWVSGSAREALNFSQWQSYSAKQRAHATGLIASVVGDGSMPPADYTFFVRSARLGADRKEEIAKWAAHDGAAPAH